MSLESYKPIWPETVIFWGAGATSALNMHTTDELGQAIYCLARRNKKLTDRVEAAFRRTKMLNCIADLLIILGDDEIGAAAFPSEEQTAALNRQFDGLSAFEQEQRGRELRYTYDWGTLRQLIHICPGHNEQFLRLQDLFNLLDMHIMSRHGFYVYGDNSEGQRFIPPEALVLARNALIMLIGLLHFHDYQTTLEQNGTIYEQYIGFAEILAEMMQQEGLRFYEKSHRFSQRKFYLFSYAIINMNWDAILLWLVFNAHRRLNNASDVPLIDNPAVPLKLFHDLSHFMGVRRIDSNNPDVWYPLNESVVQRLNDPDQKSSRRVRIGKFYFPHGCSGWRECPSCGKLTMYLGDQWQYNSVSLFPPPLLPKFSAGWYKPRSLEEKIAHGQGRSDTVQCAYCGTLTELRHTPLVMQSNFKGNHPPFLEEIQRDMRIALEKAEHIVMMGYTLPSDDVIYRSLLSARQKRYKGKGPYCSVIVGKHDNAPDCWLCGEELSDYMQRIRNQESESSFVKAVEAAQEIFGPDRVRGYARGIPNVFINERGMTEKGRVIELLYPKECFPKQFAMREH
ncbi:hypothetical protein [Dendrosporobacter sp. 1207_IL3150]|uniref:hypothetical protein n=1 Tax=Dendrosporobacter sp. 1207_IL3150 TaxID=3084054 RepID=UPI002FDB31B8